MESGLVRTPAGGDEYLPDIKLLINVDHTYGVLTELMHANIMLSNVIYCYLNTTQVAQTSNLD